MGNHTDNLIKQVTQDKRFSRIQFKGKSKVSGHRLTVSIEAGELSIFDNDLTENDGTAVRTVDGFTVESIEESPTVARYMEWHKHQGKNMGIALTTIVIMLGYIIGSTLGAW